MHILSLLLIIIAVGHVVVWEVVVRAVITTDAAVANVDRLPFCIARCILPGLLLHTGPFKQQVARRPRKPHQAISTPFLLSLCYQAPEVLTNQCLIFLMSSCDVAQHLRTILYTRATRSARVEDRQRGRHGRYRDARYRGGQC